MTDETTPAVPTIEPAAPVPETTHAEALTAATEAVATDVAHDAERDTRSELHKAIDYAIAEAEKAGHWAAEELIALKAKL